MSLTKKRKNSKNSVEQLSLFENPQGPTVAQFKDQLVAEFRTQKGAYLQEARKKRKRNRADSIFLPEDQRAYQDSFLVQPVYPYPDWCFPPVSTKPEDVKSLIRQAALTAGAGVPNVRLGLDFEFNPDKHKISIIGVASSVFAAACKWDDSFLPLLYTAIDVGVVFVGHWVLGADKFELENAARESGLAEILARPDGYLTPRSAWLDSMGLHYLCNQALCKSPGKESDSEGSLGYMGISSAAFLSTSLPVGWKHCRGAGCTGPCPKCLRGESLVYCADGESRRINWIVKNKWQGEVLSFDVNSNKIVAKRIYAWYHNPRGDRKLLRVSYAFAGRNFKGTVMTDDHEILTDCDTWVKAGSLVSGETFIATGTMQPGSIVRKMLCGVLLGDTSVRGGKIKISHCAKQQEYLLLKAQAISASSGGYKLTETKNLRVGQQQHFSVDIYNSPFFKKEENEFRGNWRLYVASRMSLESLAIWYMDDGSYAGYQCKISVASYTAEERQFLCDTIFRATGLVCRVVGKLIVFGSTEAQKLSTQISPYVPPCMRYKLHPAASLKEFDASLYVDTPDMFYSPAVVEPACGRKNWNNGNEIDNNLYCIGVEDTENFITQAGVVHNCRVFDYCAVDAYSGLVIAENYIRVMQQKSIPFSCYEKWAELTLDVCLRAESRGLLVNKPFLDTFDKELEKTKAELFPHENSAYKYFNPQSGKQIIDYFADRGIPLRDSHGKASSTKNVILAALENELTKYGFRDVSEFENSDDQVVLSEVDELLYKLFLYKDTGKDSTAWFNQEKKFLVQHDGAWWIHPRFSTTGASTTRLSSSRPNFQNFKKRGLGAAIRKAIIPRPGCIMCANDAKQLEFRIVSYEAGIEVPGYDFFDWLVGRANGQFEKAAETMHAKARHIAKRVNHASAYGEGFRLFDHWQLSTKRTHQQVVDGSLRIFEDWIMDGKVVGFTGANLAQTLFGDKTDISRRKALNLQFDVWLRAVPEIHPWHRKMSKIAERGWAQLRTGHYLELLGSPSDNFKAGCAYYGQGGGSQFMQDKMIMCARMEPNYPMCAQIHDDLMWDNLPSSWTTDEIKRFVAHLSDEETPSFPGLLVPFETQTGPNWGEMRVLSE